MQIFRFLSVIVAALLCLPHPPAQAAHGYALWGDLKYPAGFANFDYVNPAAPKGGELRMVSSLRASTFDKYNPFTIKGNAPAYLSDLMFESLLTGSLDETASGYGLLAEDVSVPPDGLSATFRLRPEARFHNGDPVLSADVKHSYDMLMGPHALPSYKTLLEEVAGLDVVDERTVRFRFKKPNRDLPLTVGGLPIFSRKWGVENGKAKSFDQIVFDIPVGSGPYKIGPVKFGKDMTFVRDPNYWAANLNVQRGANNFDRITVKLYRDGTARLEALKAGEFDLMEIFSSGDWARRVKGRKFDTGELAKNEFVHKMPMGYQSYVPNSRKPLLKDARVRQALGLGMDFEWMTRQMFYGAYQRVDGLFSNTDCKATGTPGSDELALLEPWRKDIPASVFGAMPKPPRTDGDSSLRANLRQAIELFRQAGWEVRDGAMRNDKGEPFVIEMLESNEGQARTTSSWFSNLRRIGVTVNYRQVDFALWQQRVRVFDFDLISVAYGGTHNPGQEYADLFGSQAAATEDSGNFSGAKNPALDAVIAKMASAKIKAEMLPACRALERIVVHSHYLIPAWSSARYRVVSNNWRLARQDPIPPYVPYAGTPMWAAHTWWAKPGDSKTAAVARP